MAKLTRIFEIAQNADTVKRFKVTDADGVARVWAGTESATCQFRWAASDASPVIDLANSNHGSISLDVGGYITITIKQSHAVGLSIRSGVFDVIISNSVGSTKKRQVEGNFKVTQGVTR